MTQDGPGEAEVGHLEKLEADAIVIAGGAWSRNVLRLLGLKDYSEPIRRQISVVDNREFNLAAYGMIVDTTRALFSQRGAAHPRRIFSAGGARLSFQLRRRGILSERNLAAHVCANVAMRAAAPRHRMGRALRGLARSQRHRRARGAFGLRGAFIQRPRRHAVIWRGAGARGTHRGRKISIGPRCFGAGARSLRSNRLVFEELHI